jgi:hypothetical protein
MLLKHNLRSATAAFAFAAALWVTSAMASAQSPAPLPTAPGADRTVNSGAPATAARASLPGDNGSPVEPYLFMFILAGGGIIGVIGVKLSDRSVRADHTRFDANGSRHVLGFPVIR